MDPVTLFVLVTIATTQATSLQYDCSVNTPAAAASGMDDLQQLQYCLINNCTVIRTDTGQQLDIAYTTQSHLVVTPTDGQTSQLILKNEPEQFCFPSNSTLLANTILLILASILSGFVAAIFLFFKEIRTKFGKMMMLYSIGRTFYCVTILILTITTVRITVNSTMICYAFFFSLLLAGMIAEESITCILAFLAYIMHSSYKSIELRKGTKKRFYKCSVAYNFGLPLLLCIFTISYDFGSGMYQHVILSNGHCSFFPGSPYTTITRIGYTNLIFNRIIQIIFLVIYFTYFYKFQNATKLIRSMATSNKQKDQFYFKLAVAMAATVGVSKFLYLINGLIGYSYLLVFISLFSLLAQQALILVLITCSRKMANLCKERFCTTETSP